MDDESLELLEEVRREIKEAIEKSKDGSWIDEIRGCLSHVKGKTSVQLQHEAMKIRAEMAMHYKKQKGWR